VRPSTTLRSAQDEEQFSLPLILSVVEGRTAFVPSVPCDRRPEELAARYALYAGHAAHKKGNLFVVELGRSRVIVVAPEHLGDVVPGAAPPALPFLAGFTVATESLAKARRVLTDAAVPFADHRGRLVVGAENAFGSAVLFEGEGATR
jgi:hypothetical protein